MRTVISGRRDEVNNEINSEVLGNDQEKNVIKLHILKNSTNSNPQRELNMGSRKHYLGNVLAS